MRWTDRNWIVRTGAIAIVLAAAGAASAEIIVVRATGPSAARFRLGTILSDNQTVSLPSPRDQLTLLNDTRTWTVQGPGTVSVRGAPAGARAASTPRVLLANGGRERIGAVRGVGGASLERPNLWMVDIAQPGPACVVDPSALVLWRENEAAAATTTIIGPDNATTTVQWAAGEESQAWPSEMPYVAGATYTIATAGQPPVSLVLTPLGAEPTSVSATAGALIRLGCEAQLEVLTAMADTSEAPAPDAPAS